MTPFSAIYDPFSRRFPNIWHLPTQRYITYFIIMYKDLMNCWLLCCKYWIDCIWQCICFVCRTLLKYLTPSAVLSQDTSQILTTFTGCICIVSQTHLKYLCLCSTLCAEDTLQILDTFDCLPTQGGGRIDWRALRWPPIRIVVISINPTELYSTTLLYGPPAYMAQ